MQADQMHCFVDSDSSKSMIDSSAERLSNRPFYFFSVQNDQATALLTATP
jgi:hypothetical protein